MLQNLESWSIRRSNQRFITIILFISIFFTLPFGSFPQILQLVKKIDMKKIVLSILILLSFQTSLFSDSEMTNGFRNGNFWINLNDAGRLYFVVGFSEGRDSIYYNLYSQIKFKKTKALMEKTLNEEYYAGGIIYKSLIDFLDKFYSTAQYRIISIEEALRWFILSANGKITVKEIDDRATEMLKFYVENPPEMT
jgi:hypothetical protein